MNGPAVLSGAMLARKGTATPTGYTPLRPQAAGPARGANQNGANPRPAPVPAPVTPAVGGGSPPAASERSRVSVRLDRDRHFKLKLTAAHLESSLQDVIIDALDRYLEQIGPEVLRNDCACLGVKNGARRGCQAD
jgi:hypothetical protein